MSTQLTHLLPETTQPQRLLRDHSTFRLQVADTAGRCRRPGRLRTPIRITTRLQDGTDLHSALSFDQQAAEARQFQAGSHRVPFSRSNDDGIDRGIEAARWTGEGLKLENCFEHPHP